MKILFLTDNFPPEVNAPASRTFDHCRQWVKNGDEVTVITCAPNFPQGVVYKGYRNRPYQEEMIEGIRVIRVWSYIAENRGVLKRTLDFISYSMSAFIAGLFVKTDLIVATSPQFFTALAGRALSFWKRKPWVMEVRDLWPESIKTVGAMKQGMLIRYFEKQELKCYRSARRIVVVTDSFKRKLTERGVTPEKIEVVKNGVDRTLFAPMPKDNDIIRQLGLENKKVIGYIGTIGMAHKLDFIIDCAKKLEDSDNYHFLFMGNGAEKKNLAAYAEEKGVTNVTILEGVSKKEVKRYISVLDAALINLKKSELFTTVIPSKIFENAAMEIPILMGVDGEARSIVEGYGAGVCFEPENENDFIEKLKVVTDHTNLDKFRQGSRRLAADFDRNILAGKMQNILHNI